LRRFADHAGEYIDKENSEITIRSTNLHFGDPKAQWHRRASSVLGAPPNIFNYNESQSVDGKKLAVEGAIYGSTQKDVSSIQQILNREDARINTAG